MDGAGQLYFLIFPWRENTPTRLARVLYVTLSYTKKMNKLACPVVRDRLFGVPNMLMTSVHDDGGAFWDRYHRRLGVFVLARNHDFVLRFSDLFAGERAIVASSLDRLSLEVSLESLSKIDRWICLDKSFQDESRGCLKNIEFFLGLDFGISFLEPIEWAMP